MTNYQVVTRERHGQQHWLKSDGYVFAALPQATFEIRPCVFQEFHVAFS